MSSLSGRIRANLLWLVLFSATVLLASFLRFASSGGFEDPYLVTVTMPAAGGVLPAQEVTVLGRAVGQVADVRLAQEGVEIDLEILAQYEVPASATVQVLRRSPIGEQAVDFQPDSPDWTPAEPGATIDVTEAIVPAEVPFLLDRTVKLFSAIDTDDLGTVIHELALALEGRGGTLVQLGRDSLDLNRTLVAGIPELERLTEAETTQVLDTLRDSSDELAQTFDNAADLAELLAEEAPTIERLLETSPVALSESAVLIEEQSANLGCLMGDLIDLNDMLTGETTWDGAPGPGRGYENKLDEFEKALQRHRSFFQEGFAVVGQPEYATGVYWTRIDLQLDETPGGQRYPQKRPTPQTKPGAACVSPEFGLGVNAVRQADAQPPDETAPPIDYAALVSGERARGTGVVPPTLDGRGGGGLAATGGGVLLVAPLLLGLGLALRRRG